MDKITTGISYGTSGIGALYWMRQLLDGFTPDEWVGIGVLGSLLFAFLTFLVNLYFKRREFRSRGKGDVRNG